MKGPIILGALLAVLLAVPVAMERNRITPDVWTGAPTTVRAEMSQEARDSEMRSKMAGQVPAEMRTLLARVETYAPINAISAPCGLQARDQSANSAMLEGARQDPEVAKRVARLHSETQAAYRAARDRGDKEVFCSDFLAANQSAVPFPTRSPR